MAVDMAAVATAAGTAEHLARPGKYRNPRHGTAVIQAYPARPAVFAGERLRLHVSSAAPRFRVEFYRQGVSLVLRGRADTRPCRHHPPGPPDRPWNWSAEDYDIPADWIPGVYLALLVEVGEDGRDLSRPEPVFDGRDSRALFVIRPRSPAHRILYKLAWATYHAYNASGGASLYVGQGWLPSSGPSRLTTQRPGGGTGGVLSFPGDIDVYDPGTPREGFAHWDAPMIAWLEAAGYGVDVCTDLDLQDDPGLLDGYRLLLSVGHDEYWSAEVRDAVQCFASRGGNVAFLGGNTCWWRVAFDAQGQHMTCLHPPVSQAPSDQWWRIDPENRLTGVSYRNGGGWWSGEREPLGYTVQHAGHWVFEGTGLRDGDVVGASARLVGYECDGARLIPRCEGVRRADGRDGTPADFVVLGHAVLGPGWQDRPLGAEATATLGLHAPGGTVFNVGTTDWSRVLAAGDPVVVGITRNVLDALSSVPLRIEGPVHEDLDQPDDAILRREGAVAGGTRVRFSVTRPAGAGEAPLRWTVAIGDEPASALAATDDVVSVDVPAQGGLLTVTARLAGDVGAAFGSRTLRLLSRRETEQVRLLCALRDLVLAAVPAVSPTRPVGPGNRPFGDADWEPLRDGLRAMIAPGTFVSIESVAHRLLDANRSLSD